MADTGEKTNSSDSETYIDEIKPEDYNFYVLNNILSQNIILQNYLNEEGTLNAVQESFMNFAAPNDPCEILSHPKQGQSQRVALKDTFLEDVLSTSTKSFIERISKSHINKKTSKKILSHYVCKDDKSTNSNSPPSRTPCSPAVSLDTDIKSNASSTTLALDEIYTNTPPSTVTPGTRSYSEEDNNLIDDLIATDESRTLPQKRKGNSCGKNSPSNVQKKVKMLSTYSDSNSPNIIKKDCSQELNCTTDIHDTTINHDPESVGSVSQHQKDDKTEQSGDMRGNMPNEAETLTTKSSSSNYTVISDTPSDDFEWSTDHLQLFGLALPEDRNLETLAEKSESSITSFSPLDTCSHGCRDLMSSEHLYHLHLAALKLSQKETCTSESFAESAKYKNDMLSQIKNKVLVERKGSSRSHGYPQSENSQEKNIKINSDAIGNKSADVVVNNTDQKESSGKTILNGIRREAILKSNIKLCDQVACQFCEKSENHVQGKLPVQVHCVRNPGNKAGVLQSINCSNTALPSPTSVTQGSHNNLVAHNAALTNNSYNIAPSSASSHFYKPSGIYGFGNVNNENYIQLEPFSMPNSSMWFGKQAQSLHSPFSTTNVSPHLTNSPWYQQWFHAMSMRRSLATQVPSMPCSYFEPLKMNHYRKMLWGTPNVGQQRMYQRPSSTMSSLPRMFQTPSLHSCFPATISCGDHQTGTHVQYGGQQPDIVAASHSPVSMETDQENNFKEPGTS